MLVLIKKDESTTVPREVADMGEARALAAQGMPVFVQAEDGTQTEVDAYGADEAAEGGPAAEAAAPAKKTARKR